MHGSVTTYEFMLMSGAMIFSDFQVCSDVHPIYQEPQL